MTDNNHDNDVVNEVPADEHGAPIEEVQKEPDTTNNPVEETPEALDASTSSEEEKQSGQDTASTSAEEAGKEPDSSADLRKHESKPSEVVGIRFRSCGKVYTFDANNIELAQGARVVVDSEMGLSMGSVVTLKHIRKRTKEPLKKVVRLASEKDFETIEGNRALQDEAKAFCVEKSKELHLQMKVVTTEMTLDKKRLIFYFTADGRIDFRELVRDLAAKFKTRIEMRQIGVRDEVKMLGGIGACGRQTCCNQFLTSFAPITIRMAKQQSLSINQSKLSGICGRLMCCLGYEYHDGPVKETPAIVTITGADENVEEAAEPVNAESTKRKPPQKPGTARVTKKPIHPHQEEQKDDAAEKSPEAKKPARSNRRRRRRRRGGKAPSEAAGQVKQQTTGTPGTQKPAGEGDKKSDRRPGNKRKRFWKKKKKKEE